jgi:hypothetical protein
MRIAVGGLFQRVSLVIIKGSQDITVRPLTEATLNVQDHREVRHIEASLIVIGLLSVDQMLGLTSNVTYAVNRVTVHAIVVVKVP